MIEINLMQAKNLVEAFSDENDLVLMLTHGDDTFHSGPGLYVRDEYPDHGLIFLGKDSDE